MAVFRLTESPLGSTDTSSRTPDPKKNITEKENTRELKRGVIKEIVLKGPLGHAYTEALNLLLNKRNNKTGGLRQETMQQAFLTEVLPEDQRKVEAVPENARGYVYVYDGRKMASNDLTNMFEDLAGAKDAHPEAGYVSGTIENAEDLLENPIRSKVLSMVQTGLQEKNITLHYDRERSLEAIAGFLKEDPNETNDL